MDFNKLLEKDYIFLDGAMGTMLQAQGLKLGSIPEVLSITEPEKIIGIHKAYLEAGSQVVYANTFGANSYKLKDCPYSPTEIIKAAVKNAKEACKDYNGLVALDIGPIGQLLEPTGSLTF